MDPMSQIIAINIGNVMAWLAAFLGAAALIRALLPLTRRLFRNDH